MMNKKLKEYYSDINEEKIRNRIFTELGLPEEPSAPSPIHKHRRSYFAILSAAAVLVVVSVLRVGLFSPDISDKTVQYDTNTGYSVEEPQEAAEESSDILFFPSETGWSYSNVSLSAAKSYNYSDFDSTPPPYFENNSSDELFVESEVLKNTDFFLDCIVENVTYDSNTQSVSYTVSPIHVICPENISLSETVTLVSGTAYVMSEGMEYLLPVTDNGGSYSITDSSSPKTMITPEGYVIYQNGWQSLADSGSRYIAKDKASPDDFFYDRMNITAESSLQNLFDSFLETKEVNPYEKK